MNTFTWKEASEIDKISFDPQDVFDAGMRHHAIANTAYPINHPKTMKHYRVARDDIEQHIIDAWTPVEKLCLYVHVPFCEKICKFCDYSVMNPEIREVQEPLYFEALKKEMDMYRDRVATTLKEVIGLDIGGGTPSAVDTKYISLILDQVQKNFRLRDNMNISIETTPKIAATHPEKIRDYYNMGIRRISMGIQTVTPEAIGRESTSVEWNKRAMANMREAGFEQCNIDLMYGFAKQQMKHVQASVEHALSLSPEFVTLYRMRYKRTGVEQKATEVSLAEVHEQYSIAKNLLASAGYEVRNGKNTFSKMPGNDGLSDYLHNRVERAVPYLGFGMGAQGFNPKGTLSYNGGAAVKHPDHYYKFLNEGKLPVESANHLSREVAMAKMISVSFYSGGIHRESFKDMFHLSIEEAFPHEIAFLKEHGYMVDDEKYGTLQLTALGTEYHSGVISLFYSGEVKKYLLEIGENEWMGTTNTARPIMTKLSLNRVNGTSA